MALNLPKKSIDCCKKALDVNDKYMDAYYGIITLLLKIGESKDALHYVNKSLNIEPLNEYLLLLKGCILGCLNRTYEALLYFNKVKETSKNF